MSRILALTFHNYMTVKRLLTAESNLQVLMLSHILLSSSRSIQPQYVKKYSRNVLINNITILQPLEPVTTVSIVFVEYYC